ncbi:MULTISPECIES: acetate uptake transporter [Tepidibacillus]|uniref:Uncharacterized protein n=1 Tax=Tepidibacillus fermentans TaxID=1281767 RepID=A0A4R3KFG9_9BACI|nr:GPR1/FUN34/YaaH family transporter [Tepidibacillus fermentans]TCS82114.1 hypothetical protein EDD72_11050 [Tepidibacillus fermentans]
MSGNEEKQFSVVEPGGIGLLGLAIVTLVASSQKLGITQGFSYAVPWALFLGAFAQLFASINDSKRNNIFGSTAFAAYAFFWFAVGITWLIQMGAFGEELKADVDIKQLGFAFVGYLIFSIYMTIGSMETNKVLFIIFVLIDLLFIGLSLSSFQILPEFSHKLAAWSELAISMVSFYGSAATVLNHHFGRQFLPTGKPLGIFK